MYLIQQIRCDGVIISHDTFPVIETALAELFLWCQRDTDSAFRILHGKVQRITPWCKQGPSAVYVNDAAPQPQHTDILQNELITYAQAGTTRLQQLIDLFGEMVQDKSGDPAMRIQHIDALADIIKNQLQELQTIATPSK